MRSSIVLFLGLSACNVSRGIDQPVQQAVGAAGGSIVISDSQSSTLAGTQLVIPPGALPDGTMVTISQGGSQNRSGEQAVSPSVRLQPDGLVLSKPATLFVPYSGQPRQSRLLVEATSLGNRSEQAELLVSTAAGLAQFQIGHFGDWQIVAIDCAPQTYEVDLAQPSYDMGSGSTDLATSPSDLGPPSQDLAPGGSDDGGDVADLAPVPAGYAPPLSCGDDDPVDLALPKG